MMTVSLQQALQSIQIVADTPFTTGLSDRSLFTLLEHDLLQR
ncbi:MAG: hypothetical protein ACR2QT_05495 [Woeseiaceae bacterium]